MVKEETSKLKELNDEALNDEALTGEQPILMDLHEPDLINAIEHYMAERDINASQLAAALGYSKSKVSELLNHRRPLSKKMAKALHDLGLPANVLFKALID